MSIPFEKEKLAALEIQRQRFLRNSKQPKLQQLFFELTQKCNLNCWHCGSKCDEHQVVEQVAVDKFIEILQEVKENFGTDVFIVLTGGEPLLYADFDKLTKAIHDLGFHWGMTTNGTLLNEKTVNILKTNGCYSLSISIDGPELIHEQVRQVKGCYQKTINGILAVREYYPTIGNLQVTSVLNHNTIQYLNDLWEIMLTIPIDSWRIMNVEPIGSANNHPELFFTADDFKTLFAFIKAKRLEDYPVTYGCCHYLGLENEGELRSWFYLCNAGIHIASIMSNGDIGSCLDIERRPETIFGNIYKDSFTDVWKNGFKLYREGLWNKNETCKNCNRVNQCRGDSIHSWNFDENKPNICLKQIFNDENF